MEVPNCMRSTKQQSPFLLLFSRWMYLATAVLVLLGCSSDSSNKAQRSSEPLPQLDPASAQLYPAQQEAKARDFEVTLMNGETFSLSDHQGEVVVLNIWATWCAPCLEEMPDFVDLYETYREQGLMVLGVSIDKRGEAAVQPFVDKLNVTYPIVIDRGTIMDKYGPTMGIPTTYIIGREGNLQYFAVGALTKKELEPRLQDLLDNQ